MVFLLSLGMYFGCCNPMKAQQKPPPTQPTKRETMDNTPKADWSSWASHSAVQTMIAQYGDPAEVSSEGAVWYDQGPYKRIRVMRNGSDASRQNYTEYTIAYPKMRKKRLKELMIFDNAIVVNKPAREVSVRYDLESQNVRSLELTRDILDGTTTAQEARMAFDQEMARDATNATYKKGTQLPPLRDNVPYSEKPMKSTEMTRDTIGSPYSKGTQAPRNRDSVSYSGKSKNSTEMTRDTMGSVYKKGTQIPRTRDSVPYSEKPKNPTNLRNAPNGQNSEGEILAFLAAVNQHEIDAAAAAKSKEISEQVSEYAMMLSDHHSSNLEKTMALSDSINIEPQETESIKEFKKKGKEELTKLAALEGKGFESAYLDAMIKGHTEVLAWIDSKWTTSTKSEALKAHLDETRIQIAMHLEEAKKLRDNK